MLTLVIGDSHIEEGDNLLRYKALSNLMVTLKPETLVQIGDFLSLDSLSAWDQDKRANLEGKRFQEELNIGKRAVDLLFSSVDEYNNKQKEKKQKQYNPQVVWHFGNHEDRWLRYTEKRPELIGAVDIATSLGLYDKKDLTVVPYREYSTILGVQFTHVPMNNVNQPISGQYVCRRALESHPHSVVFGHNHELKIDTLTRHGDLQNTAISVGCFFEGVPTYARGSLASNNWWRGVVLLDQYAFNRFSIHTLPLAVLLRDYL